jgi:hypothetical protein
MRQPDLTFADYKYLLHVEAGYQDLTEGLAEKRCRFRGLVRDGALTEAGREALERAARQPERWGTDTR